MTNKTETEELATCRQALKAILKAAANTAEEPTDEQMDAALEDVDALIRVVAGRLETLRGADQATAQLMELATEMAARGDRWKKLAGRGYDTLTTNLYPEGYQAENQSPTLAERIDTWCGQSPCEEEETDVDLLVEAKEKLAAVVNLEAAVDARQEAALVYRQRYADACKFVSAEQLAERVQLAFKDAVKKGEQLRMMAAGIQPVRPPNG